VKLRALYDEAVTARWASQAAAARADAAIARYNEALALEHQMRLVPFGFEIDVLGDGSVKPSEQCAKHPPLVTPNS
jgi:hypothetical protein